MKTVYSTEDIAHIMGECTRIVNRYFDSGRLKGTTSRTTFVRYCSRAQVIDFFTRFKFGTLDEDDVLQPLEKT